MGWVLVSGCFPLSLLLAKNRFVLSYLRPGSKAGWADSCLWLGEASCWLPGGKKDVGHGCGAGCRADCWPPGGRLVNYKLFFLRGLARYSVYTTATWDHFWNITQKIWNNEDGVLLVSSSPQHCHLFPKNTSLVNTRGRQENLEVSSKSAKYFNSAVPSMIRSLNCKASGSTNSVTLTTKSGIVFVVYLFVYSCVCIVFL